MTETDLSKAFGYDETKDMDGPDAYKYFIEKLELEPSDAEERVRQQGKNPFKDKKKITISEIQKQKMIKMVEDILMKKRAADKSDVTSKEKDVETTAILKKNLKSLKRQAEREGLSLSQLVKLVKSE